MSQDDVPVQPSDLEAKPSPERPTTGEKSEPTGGSLNLRAVSFSGPIPPPDLLRGYEEVCAGLADRMFAFVEKQGDHDREIEKQVVAIQAHRSKAQLMEARIGQCFAFLITVAAMLIGGYTALRGHELAGGIIGVGGVGGIVTTFVIGRPRSKYPAPIAPPESRASRNNAKNHSAKRPLPESKDA